MRPETEERGSARLHPPSSTPRSPSVCLLLLFLLRLLLLSLLDHFSHISYRQDTALSLAPEREKLRETQRFKLCAVLLRAHACPARQTELADASLGSDHRGSRMTENARSSDPASGRSEREDAYFDRRKPLKNPARLGKRTANAIVGSRVATVLSGDRTLVRPPPPPPLPSDLDPFNPG